MDEPIVPEAVRARLAAVTIDFSPNGDRRGFVGGGGYGFAVPRVLGSQPAVLRFLLQHVLGFQNLGRFEKVSWECVFLFRGTPASIAHRKSGVRVYLGGVSRPEAKRLHRQVWRPLVAALEVLERDFLTAYAQRQLEADAVTVLNQAWRMREMYDYFSEGSQLAYAGDGRMRERTATGWRILHREIEGSFNTVATVAAYFSWLEHVLALCLPFVPGRGSTVALSWFLRQRWRGKWRVLFDTEVDHEASKALARLGAVADRYRNPFLHGAVNATSGTVGFHLPGCGAISMTLRQEELTPSLYLLPFDQRGFDQARRAFAATDRFLHKHQRTRLAMQWVDAGLDVAYDEASRHAYAAASSSQVAFDTFLRASAEEHDMHANMDW